MMKIDGITIEGDEGSYPGSWRVRVYGEVQSMYDMAPDKAELIGNALILAARTSRRSEELFHLKAANRRD